MPDVRPRVVHGERLEVIAGRDALGELTEILALEQRDQLGLADQDDLQKLLSRRFQIREEPDLLEHLGREILRLVDDDDRASAARVRIEQVAIERVDERLHTRRVRGHRDA